MAKGQREETAEIVDPRRMSYRCYVTDQDWEELAGLQRITNDKAHLRDLLFELIGSMDEAARKQNVEPSRVRPFRTIVVEVYSVPER